MRILITGGDHVGKDSLARALTRVYPAYNYHVSSSRLFADSIDAWKDGRDLDKWWVERRNHREEWIEQFDLLRSRYRPAIFATSLFADGASIVTGLRFTSELIDLLTSEYRPDIILWCRYTQQEPGPDILTLDLATQLGAIANVPVLVVWSDQQAPLIHTLIIRYLNDPMEDMTHEQSE